MYKYTYIYIIYIYIYSNTIKDNKIIIPTCLNYICEHNKKRGKPRKNIRLFEKLKFIVKFS